MSVAQKKRLSVLLISAIPVISETIYTPLLPNICKLMNISESSAEQSVTIYLLAFACGILYWGKLSDIYGRKPCVLMGLICFIIGCIGCFFSTNSSHLMISRLVQGFGISIGSVLGQAITRDSFSGKELTKAYAWIGSYTGLLIAIGSVIGLNIAHRFSLEGTFAFLFIIALVSSIFIHYKMPETHLATQRKSFKILSVSKQLYSDKRVVGLCLLVAGCNGIRFSYLAEAPFCIIDMLNMPSKVYYNSLFILLIGTFLGGLFAKKITDKKSANQIIIIGLFIMMCATLISLTSTYFLYNVISNMSLAKIISISQGLMSFGHAIASNTCLASALIRYKHCTGTASSIFGFSYYIIISIITYGMGHLHNGLITTMPIYFMFLMILMLVFYKYLVFSTSDTAQEITSSSESS